MYMYSYCQIALTSSHAVIGHTRTSKSTDYCPNCTRKCVINYDNTQRMAPQYHMINTRVFGVS